MSGILSHTPAFILRSRIISDGKGSEWSEANPRQWPIFVDGEPNLPDNCITIRDTNNRDLGFNQPRKELQEYYGVQVRVRAKDVPTGFPKYNSLVVAIERYIRDTVTIGNVVYRLTSYVASDMFLGKETAVSRRVIWTINAMLDIHQTNPVPIATP